MNHCYVDPRLRCIGQGLVVLAQPTAPAEPRECSLDHPSSGQHLKLMAVPGTFHNFKRPACQGPDPLDQLSGIACIGPDQSQTWKPPYHFVYDQLRSISVLNISRMYHHGQHQPYGIHYDVSLSTVDLLASIIATRPPFSVVFTDWLSMMAALGVGLLPSASRTAGAESHGLFPTFHPSSTCGSICTLSVPGGQIVREHPPWASAPKHIQDAVEHLPQVHCTWSSPGLGCWE